MDAQSTPFGAALALMAAGPATAAVGFGAALIAARAGFLLDRPNGRSSHSKATPRSGGIAIFAGWAGGMAVAAASPGAAMLWPAAKLALVAGGVFVAGLADDLFDLRPLVKLAGQVLAAAVFVLLFGPIEAAPVPGLGALPLGALGPPLTVFWIVAFMNAFNFMDGVNGIAAASGAFMLAALAVASACFGAPFWAAAAALAAIALAAFLPVNFPGGRLFMGDNGSQTVGFLIAAIAAGAARETQGAMSALFAPVAALPFLFDVALTLAHRAIRGRNILAAHCEHLYQLLVRMGASHARVTAVYLALTALATAGAIMMLRLAPEDQWFAPAALILLMAAPAMMLLRRAQSAGLFAHAAEKRLCAGAENSGESAPASDDSGEPARPAVHTAE